MARAALSKIGSVLHSPAHHTSAPGRLAPASRYRRLRHRWKQALSFSRWSIAARLTAIVLALAIPLNLVIGSVAWHFDEAAKDARTSLLYTARSIAAAVDAKLGGDIALAEAVSASPALLPDSLDAFETQTRGTFASIPGMWVQVADLGGKQLFNTASPAGEPLPPLDPIALAAQKRAFETHSAVVSSVHFSPILNDWIVNIDVPVFKEGQTFRTLAILMRAQSFLDVLTDGKMPNGWVAGVIDPQNRFVARAPSGSKRVGYIVSKSWDKAADKDGVFDTVSADGDPIVFANAHTSIGGWPVSVVVKKSELAETGATIGWAEIGGGVLSLLSLFFAIFVARRVTGPIQELRDNANMLLASVAVPMPSGPPEVRELWEAFSRSADSRNRAVEALRKSEARWEAEAAALQRLNGASSRLWRAGNLREGLEEMLAASIELLGANKASIQLLDPVRGTLTIAAQRGFEESFLDVLQTVLAEEVSACGVAFRSGDCVVVEDVQTEERFAPLRSVAAASRFRSLQSTPLKRRDGALIGVLSTFFSEVRRPTVQDLQRLDLYARQAGGFIMRCRNDELLRTSEERFRGIYEHAGTGIAMMDLQGRLQSCNPACSAMLGYKEDELRGHSFWGLIHSDDRDHVMLQNSRLLAHEATSFEAVSRLVRKDGGSVWTHQHVSLLQRSSGAPTNIIALLTDMTERKRHEEQIRLLMREVNHRSKNMLALVQAVARQTAASRPEDFTERFSERIQALAASQDLLVESEWKGANLDGLVRSQLGHFKDLIGKRIELKGPRLFISVAAAQAIGMAIHELATNASKYGALSCSEGHIQIEWSVTAGGEGEKAFVMDWREMGGPPVKPPSRKGFGSTVVRSLAESSLNAEVELDFPATGLVWTLRCSIASITCKAA